MEELNIHEDHETGIFKIIAVIIGILALLSALTAGILIVRRKILAAMAKINDDTRFEPFDEEDLLSTDALPQAKKKRGGICFDDD